MRENESPSVPRGTDTQEHLAAEGRGVQLPPVEQVRGSEGAHSPAPAGQGSAAVQGLPPASALSSSEEEDRKAAYRWVAALITERASPDWFVQWPLPQRVWLEVLDIRDAMECAGIVPLSPTVESGCAGPVPAPEPAAGLPPTRSPAPSFPDEPGIHGVSCDEMVGRLNAGWPWDGLAEDAMVERALRDHLVDCPGCGEVAKLRVLEARS